jgi:signal transduction histidine kinase
MISVKDKPGGSASMEAAKVFKRFSLMSAGLWVGLALLLGAGITYYAERRMLEKVTIANLDYFRHLPQFMFATEGFIRARVGEDYDRFDHFVRTRLFSPKIFSIKVYDRHGVLIYHSHDRSLVGRSFPDNPNLERALRGEAVLGFSQLKGSEHVYERSSGQPRLLEVYIPILQDDSGQVIGAYEIYSPLDPLHQDVRTMRVVVWSLVIFGLLLLYGALSWTFRRASWTILEQNEALAKQADELRSAYEGLKATQEQLVRSERLASAGHLATGVVHEIGNPLASVLGMVDLLLRCQGTPKARKECRENLERVASEVVRLKGILQGLLDYARPVQGEIHIVEVNEVVERTMLLLSSQKMFRGIQVVERLQEPPAFALADERLLQQVLMNILTNAAQAMSNGGRISIAAEARPVKFWQDGTISVGRRFAPDDPATIITIADTGPGIRQEDLLRIFEPFVSTKETGKGSGLGLAICHSIIEGLKGAIMVESHLGLGTTFYIVLPSDGGALPHDG